MSVTVRFEPLSPNAFPGGREPFRVRGLAYVAALDYLDKTGERAVTRTLSGVDAAHFDQLFVASGDYDVSPLVTLYVALARAARVTPATFVETRSRKSAVQMTAGIWKPMLKTSSPEAMAERTYLAFNRFFEPTRAATIAVTPGRFEGELSRVPAPIGGFYVASTIGFVAAALELAGAKRVDVKFTTQAPDGELEGVPLERMRFVATFMQA